MTTWHVLGTLWRRWYVTLPGLAAAFFALTLVDTHPGVYVSQANVVFLAPPTPQNPNVLQGTSAGLISTAGYVEQIVNAGIDRPSTASPVTLIGQGVRDGHSIDLPDSGGQWSHNFGSAVLNVQVTGPSAHVVGARLDKLLEEVRMTTKEIQDRDKVVLKSRITTYVAPAKPQVTYATGGRPSALAGTLGLGLGLTVFSAVGMDKVLARRKRAKAATAQPEKAPVLV